MQRIHHRWKAKKKTILLILAVILSASYIVYGHDLLFLTIIMVSAPAFYYSRAEAGPVFFGISFVLAALLYPFFGGEYVQRLGIVAFAFLASSVIAALLRCRKGSF